MMALSPPNRHTQSKELKNFFILETVGFSSNFFSLKKKRGFKKVGLSVLPLFSLGMMVESILTSLGITVVCGDETTISFVLPSLHP